MRIQDAYFPIPRTVNKKLRWMSKWARMPAIRTFIFLHNGKTSVGANYQIICLFSYALFFFFFFLENPGEKSIFCYCCYFCQFCFKKQIHVCHQMVICSYMLMHNLCITSSVFQISSGPNPKSFFVLFTHHTLHFTSKLYLDIFLYSFLQWHLN